jgi:molybdopterin/thiamine biosynthesis adenylyltransferase
MIVLPADVPQMALASGVSPPLWCRVLDGGDVYSVVASERPTDSVRASLRVQDGPKPRPSRYRRESAEAVRVIVCRENRTDSSAAEAPKQERPVPPQIFGFIWNDKKGWVETSVCIVPLREQLFERTRGLFETEVVADRTVFVAGLGSVGSFVAVGMAGFGVRNVILMDFDRIEVPNLVRHVATVGDLGRLKTNVVRDAILGKNPYANVETHNVKIGWDTQDVVRDCLSRCDVGICAADGLGARDVFNKVGVDLDKPMIFPGAFRRAYGVQLLRVHPHEGPCYQCFKQNLPQQVRDQEISSDEHARRVAYSDRPVVAEPGLANDLSPLYQMVNKLTLQEILKGTSSSLRALEEDLVASWYLFFNRREPGTESANLKPLGFNVDAFSILRWYGVDLAKDPTCFCCGNHLELAAEREGIVVSPEDVAAFGGDER